MTEKYGCADCQIAIDCENLSADHKPPCAKRAMDAIAALRNLIAMLEAQTVDGRIIQQSTNVNLAIGHAQVVLQQL